MVIIRVAKSMPYSLKIWIQHIDVKEETFFDHAVQRRGEREVCWLERRDCTKVPVEELVVAFATFGVEEREGGVVSRKAPKVGQEGGVG